jgi:hypothetical protein
MKMKKSSSVVRPLRPPPMPIDLLGGFFEWMETEAGQASEEASCAVFVALENARVDIKARRIVWPDGKALTVEETARLIASSDEDENVSSSRSRGGMARMRLRATGTKRKANGPF